MKHILIILALFCFSCNEKAQTQEKKRDQFAAISSNFNQDWANQNHWDDGLAEVAVYEATRTIYGKVRSFDYTYITVSEDFNKAFRVKTDDYQLKDLYKVLKVNAFARIPTDNYPYHLLTSMFFLRENALNLDKMTTSSQEWCGNTFKEYLQDHKGFNLTYHSYWDTEGDGETKIAAGILLEDQLNYTLRALKFQEGLTFSAPVLESQISSKVGKLKVYDANFKISDDKASNTWKVELTLEKDKVNTYYFAKAYPNVLMKQNTWDGRNLVLKDLSRYAYWQQ
ncbi:hypothetical protein [Pedobacter glucosidilyticus]|uniref:hypothetical protein n=1 Tax=Pedobacter glucosidilyticus TaxID=1122941 RepID=UPI0026EAA3E2|nr:hypothetical protein [Pedobacter glucosidilyticus]